MTRKCLYRSLEVMLSFRLLRGGFLLSMMYPYMLLVIPVYLVMYHLGLLGSYIGIILFLALGPIQFFLFEQFFRTIPPAMIEEVRPRIRITHAPASDSATSGGRRALGRGALMETISDGMRLGTRVRHGKFGEGVVLTVEGQGPHARVQVNFEQQGSKWLMLQYANLEVM